MRQYFGPLSLMFVALFLRAQLSASISLSFLNSARCVATVPPFGSPIGPFVLVHMGDCFRHRARVTCRIGGMANASNSAAHLCEVGHTAAWSRCGKKKTSISAVGG